MKLCPIEWSFGQTHPNVDGKRLSFVKRMNTLTNRSVDQFRSFEGNTPRFAGIRKPNDELDELAYQTTTLTIVKIIHNKYKKKKLVSSIIFFNNSTYSMTHRINLKIHSIYTNFEKATTTYPESIISRIYISQLPYTTVPLIQVNLTST